MNSIVIKGRLTRDPEVKYVNVKGNEKAVCKISVAVNRRFGEEADFFDVQVWGKIGEAVGRNVGKGREIVIRGSMECNKWKDNDGNNRYSWYINADEVDFCGSKNDNKDSKKADEKLPEGFHEVEGDEEGEIPF